MSTHSFDDVFGPTVAGRFYPEDPTRLRKAVETYLAAGTKKPRPIDASRRVVALIAPHAGYVFSGPVAGIAYASASKDVRTVVLLSPSHHARRPHACLLGADAYRTPLGEVPIDRETVAKLDDQGKDLTGVEEAIFDSEHALDVHVPFVQVAFPQARLVPVIVPMMPRARLEALGAMLHEIVGSDPHALVVASSDLSHFYDYDEAREIDNAIVGEIEKSEVEKVLAGRDSRKGPCGAAPIVATLAYLSAFGKGAKVDRLQVLNSGDTRPSNRDRVVGYAAMVMTVPKR